MCLAVALYGLSDRIKIHVSLCGNAEEDRVEGGKGGRVRRVDRRRSQIAGAIALSK